MTLNRRFAKHAAICSILLASITAPLAPAFAGDDPIAAGDWSQLVWTSAKSGDTDALREYLSREPEGLGGRLARLKESLAAYRENLEEARIERIESRAAALEDLKTHLEAGDISQALRSAVEYQTLSDSMDEALHVAEVREVVNRAKTGIPEAIEEMDWLYAQELLFRLRTLYDDTAELALYAQYDKELKRINRRVALLQQYAPARLHELRDRLAVRYGEEPLPPFNPEHAPDWRERVENVRIDMLESALRHAASEHIESMGSEGWRPLLDGGLIAMELIATTPALSESFHGLNDQKAVQDWLRFVHGWQDRLRDTDARDLSRRYLQQIVSGLEHLNERTLGLPKEVILREFGDGAMIELSTAKEDDYSDIIWPDQIRRFRQQTEGHFVGVGIYIGQNDRRDIVVVNPLEGTPAFRAGIRPDDVIVTVDEQSTIGWSLNDAVDRITGRKGDPVVLGIKREGNDKPLSFTIIRDVIDLPSVKGWHKTHLDANGEPVWDWMIDRESGIAYIRLLGFSENTYKDLMEAWIEIRNEGAKGLILDLRFNPGGLLDQAVRVANLFIEEGEVVSIEGKPGSEREVLKAMRNRAAIRESGVDVVVLVNKGSASASEIVSGALQAHGAAVVVGTRTWGKGSVQRVYRVPPDAQLKLTTQYYRLPPREGESIGRLVHKRPNSEIWGVDPDVLVEMTPQQIEAALDLRDAADLIGNGEDGAGEERPDVNTLISEGIDPQLEMALLLLQAKSVASTGTDHARIN